jgi:hypothetical protein
LQGGSRQMRLGHERSNFRRKKVVTLVAASSRAAALLNRPAPPFPVFGS